MIDLQNVPFRGKSLGSERFFHDECLASLTVEA